MDDESIRIAVGLRLGANICEKHLCPCGAQVVEDGSHGLSCPLGPGRIPRHAILNDVVCRALARAGIPAIKETSGLSRSDGKRPDGMTLIPWNAGRSLVWDATVTDTVAATYLPDTSLSSGAAAEAAATRKTAKYIFLPLAFETFGSINEDARHFLTELGRRTAIQTGNQREGQFLYQRLSVIIQRFNSIAFRCSFPDTDSCPDELSERDSSLDQLPDHRLVAEDRSLRQSRHSTIASNRLTSQPVSSGNDTPVSFDRNPLHRRSAAVAEDALSGQSKTSEEAVLPPTTTWTQLASKTIKSKPDRANSGTAVEVPVGRGVDVRVGPGQGQGAGVEDGDEAVQGRSRGQRVTIGGAASSGSNLRR